MEMEYNLGELIFNPVIMKDEILNVEEEKVQSLTVECEFYAYPFMEKCEVVLHRPILLDTWSLRHLCIWNKKRERYESVKGLYSYPLHEAVVNQTLSLLQKAEKKGA